MSDNYKYGFDFGAMFAKGAASVAFDIGMSKAAATSFIRGLCKEAARGKYNFEDVDDDDNTFWNRNKKWLIPAIVGSLAFYVGASGERNGRKDRSYISNAGSMISDRLSTLFGLNYDSLSQIPIKTPKAPVVESSEASALDWPNFVKGYPTEQ